MSNINQRQVQKLLQKLSPQQIQMIKLLELPAVQLEQRVKQEIEENPVLEEEATEEKNIHVTLALAVMQRRLVSSIFAIKNTLFKRWNALQGIVCLLYTSDAADEL